MPTPALLPPVPKPRNQHKPDLLGTTGPTAPARQQSTTTPTLPSTHTGVTDIVMLMIRSFRGKQAAAVFQGKVPKGFPPDIAKAAFRKLRMLDAAVSLNDLRSPPGNHLEALTGDRAGQHSIRINDQWRVCFAWHDGAPHEVEIVDYH